MLEQQRGRRIEIPLSATAPGERRSVLEQIRHLRNRARQTHQSLILRVSFLLPNLDPWQYLAAIGGPKQAFVAWHGGRKGSCWLALGSLRQCPTTGNGRFQRAQDFCSKICEQVGNTGIGPLIVGNFPFTNGPAAGQGLMVPRAVIWRASEQAVCLTLHREVLATTQPYRLLAELEQAYTRIATHPPKLPTPLPRGKLARPELVESHASWCARVQDARTSISQGVFTKVVLARSVRHHHPHGFDVHGTLQTLRANHPGATSFAMSMHTSEGPGVFLGATPEPLVEVDGHRVATRAIAGTLPRTRDDKRDASELLASVKDRHEHRIVVEMLTRRLADGCSSIHVTPTEILHLPRVLHLQARLVGTQPTPGRLIDWVGRLHPSPAVGGWPCQPAEAWLHTHEPLDRGPYAAPIGWVDPQGNGQFFVAIRSAMLQGKYATAYAGAGIVGDSNPEKEWHETHHKLQAVADALVPGVAP